MALAQDLLLSSMHCVMVLCVLRRLRFIFLDGHKAEARICARNVCNIFTSLSDNKQETFGLKLIEAMAAGKPVIATDWDGYCQTVQHGETGFMEPTVMPENFGDDLVLAHASGVVNYDNYLLRASQMVSVDLRALRESVLRLVKEPTLRQKMGRRGQALARARFDWSVIMQAYRELWADLAERREGALRGPGPRPGWQSDPGEMFASYPSQRARPDSLVAIRDKSLNLKEFIRHPLNSSVPSSDLLPRLLDALQTGPNYVESLAATLGLGRAEVLQAAMVLAKWGLVRVE